MWGETGVQASGGAVSVAAPTNRDAGKSASPRSASRTLTAPRRSSGSGSRAGSSRSRSPATRPGSFTRRIQAASCAAAVSPTVATARGARALAAATTSGRLRQRIPAGDVHPSAAASGITLPPNVFEQTTRLWN